MKEIDNEKDLVKLLKSRREEKGLFQREIAEKIGCTKMTVFLFEKTGRDIGIKKTLAICKTLGVKLYWEYEEDIKKKKKAPLKNKPK